MEVMGVPTLPSNSVINHLTSFSSGLGTSEDTRPREGRREAELPINGRTSLGMPKVLNIRAIELLISPTAVSPSMRGHLSEFEGVEASCTGFFEAPEPIG